jgi:hypothetical protein
MKFLQLLASVSAIALITATNPATASSIPVGNISIDSFGPNPTTISPGPNNTAIISAASAFTGTGIYDNTDAVTANFGQINYSVNLSTGGIVGTQAPLQLVTFSSSNNLGSMTMQVNWSSSRLGVGEIFTSTGEFTTDFPAGTLGSGDFVTVNMSFPPGTCNTTTCTTADVSQVIVEGTVPRPTNANVPEPGGLIMLLTALFGLYGFKQSRKIGTSS